MNDSKGLPTRRPDLSHFPCELAAESKFQASLDSQADKYEERLGRELRMLEEQLSRRERLSIADSEEKMNADLRQQLQAAKDAYEVCPRPLYLHIGARASFLRNLMRMALRTPTHTP